MVPQGSILVFLLLLTVGKCYGSSEKVEVVGAVECSDCGKNNNVKTNHFLSGVHVTIDCKFGAEQYKTKGTTKLDEEGKFKLSLSNFDITPIDGLLKQDCFANIHSSFGAQCLDKQNEEKSSKLIFLSQSNGKLTLGLNENLKISIATCTSAFFWPFKGPPLSHLPSWPKFPCPGPTNLPLFPPLPSPTPIYENTIPPPNPSPNFNNPTSQPAPKLSPPTTPTFQKPLPPPSPFYNNPIPSPAPKLCPPKTPYFEKPLPPPSANPPFSNSGPVPAPKHSPPSTFKKPLLSPPTAKYKPTLSPPTPRFQKPISPPNPPFKKHFSPLAPTYKKPFPPHIPIVSKNPPTPKRSYPIIPKPPPVPSLPLAPKEPYPTISKAPPIPSLPPIASVSRKYFNKPKNGNQTPSPP